MPYQNHKSESALWNSFKAGQEKAFSELYRHHAPALFAYGLKVCEDQDLVKDTVQQLFTDLWRQRSGLAEVNNVNIYLLRAFRNKLFRALKSKGRFDHTVPENYAIKASPETEWILEEIQNNRIDVLKSAVDKLPIRQKEVIVLKYFKGYANREIAEVLQINEQSVANLLYRGLTSLRKKISKKSGLW